MPSAIINLQRAYENFVIVEAKLENNNSKKKLIAETGQQ